MLKPPLTFAPIQLFWERKLSGLSAFDIADELVKTMDLPKGLQGERPSRGTTLTEVTQLIWFSPVVPCSRDRPRVSRQNPALGHRQRPAHQPGPRHRAGHGGCGEEPRSVAQHGSASLQGLRGDGRGHQVRRTCLTPGIGGKYRFFHEAQQMFSREDQMGGHVCYVAEVKGHWLSVINNVAFRVKLLIRHRHYEHEAFVSVCSVRGSTGRSHTSSV